MYTEIVIGKRSKTIIRISDVPILKFFTDTGSQFYHFTVTDTENYWNTDTNTDT